MTYSHPPTTPTMQPALKPKKLNSLDIVVPLYNEEEALRQFHAKLIQSVETIGVPVKIYYVNDGSADNTEQILEEIQASDKRVQVLELSRNFGHQAALTAGLDAAQSEAVITLDGDGQHPPELIPQMIDLYQLGYDVVLTQRLEEKDLSLLKRWTSTGFYRLINRISETHIIPGAADFRLMSRPVVEGLRGMREYHRFLRGMIAWMGYPTLVIPYTPPVRLAGKSKYSLKKMLRLATDAAFSFSLVPLQIGLITGLIFFLLAILEVIYVASLWLTGQQATLEPGWSSLMFMLLLIGGTIMILLSFTGIYIGYIFQEVKRRPIYLVKHPPAQKEEAPGTQSPD